MICLGGDGELGEQVVDRGDRLELLDDRELRPDLGGGDHLEPLRRGGGHSLRGRSR
jgi:hypothetical protein